MLGHTSCCCLRMAGGSDELVCPLMRRPYSGPQLCLSLGSGDLPKSDLHKERLRMLRPASRQARWLMFESMHASRICSPFHACCRQPTQPRPQSASCQADSCMPLAARPVHLHLPTRYTTHVWGCSRTGCRAHRLHEWAACTPQLLQLHLPVHRNNSQRIVCPPGCLSHSGARACCRLADAQGASTLCLLHKTWTCQVLGWGMLCLMGPGPSAAAPS